MILIAHRGDTVNFKENTLEAFLSAFEKGADGVELDIHKNYQNIIVNHDFSFDVNGNFPYLNDVLGEIANLGRIEIEIKSYNDDTLILLKKILMKYLNSDIELTTSEIPLAYYIKKQFPDIPLGIILHEYFFQDWMSEKIVTEKIIGWGKMLKADRIHLYIDTIKNFGKVRLVKNLQIENFLVHTHIKESDRQIEEFKECQKWGIDQLTFDDINLLNYR